MTVADLLSMSWTNLTRRKGRTALTAAGVVVGVAALVLMISLALGLQREVLKPFEAEEELRTLHVTRAAESSGKGRGGSFGIFGMMGMQVLPITDKDVEELGAIPGVERALPQLDMFVRFKIEAGADPMTIPVGPVGAAQPSEEARYRAALLAGRMWDAPSERSCLLPRQLLEFRLHRKPEEILGAKVVFSGVITESPVPPDVLTYTCVGIFDADKIGFHGRKVVLPARGMIDLREATRGGAFSPIPYKKGTYAAASLRLADPKTAGTVSPRLRASGYDVLSASDMIRTVNLIFLIVEGFMACIGAIGLVVSLFGIANTMAMAVLERTREIGIMKALGARNRDIGRLFLAEAAAIGALGGAAGLALGFLAGKLGNALARGVLDLPPDVSLFHVSLWLAAGSVAFSMFVSVLAGTMPARRAARMDPVRSLRYE